MRKPRAGPLGLFGPPLWAKWNPRTSRAVKRGVGAFVRRCEGRVPHPPIWETAPEEMRRGRTDSPSLSAVRCPPPGLDPGGSGFGKVPRARAEQRVRKKSGIKAGGRLRAHLPLTPPRNAGRDKGFRDFRASRNRWSVCTPWCCVRWSFNGKSASFPHGFSVP